MKIRIFFNDRTVTATLKDSPSTQDFIKQLPLTLALEDYARTEKIAYLPSKLTSQGAPAGTSSKAGDISYYATWGNLVVFYKPFGWTLSPMIAGLITPSLYQDAMVSSAATEASLLRYPVATE